MSPVECMVLGLLYQGCKYGHEIDKVVTERHMRIWSKLTRASMYQALTRIEEKGWAKTTVEKDGNFPERKMYMLTDTGEKALKAMLHEGLASSEYVEFKISIYISFIYVLPPQEAIEQLTKRLKARMELMNTLPALSDEDDKRIGKKANHRLIKGYYQLEIEWLKSLLAELKDNLQEGYNHED
ncbi:putative transcriptional regulators [Desulfitobacterium sp. LBE]|uniref:PadR family transcriptional regulator n=1 Tax=Desulfitobacterium sp. LBE TaxID=884086 RepID=UPI00119B8D9D|nr:PadR family transcriptional regulator [Desulfitobacterium sp. LBE]TWH56996.1 putative transcriptional regulators [Desulfitobacterium sp. LBE]